MTGQSKFLKISINAYHTSERDKSIKCTNINENASSQSLDTTDFYPENSKRLLFGTKIVSIKTCDQDGCPAVLSTTDNGVFTCSCSEEKYTYLYQLLADKHSNSIDINRTDLCDVKDTDMLSSHVISLKMDRDCRANNTCVHSLNNEQSLQTIILPPDIAKFTNISTYKEIQAHLIKICLLARCHEADEKSTSIDELRKAISSKSELKMIYATSDKVQDYLKSLLRVLLDKKTRPSSFSDIMVCLKQERLLDRKIMMLYNVLKLESRLLYFFVLLICPIFLNFLESVNQEKLQDRIASMLYYVLILKFTNFANFGKFGFESFYPSLDEKNPKSCLKTNFDFDRLKGRNIADKNNEQIVIENIAEEKKKEYIEKANMKNETDLHPTYGDTDVKTDETDQDIDLNDKTKDEKERTTKSENREHREHGEGMRSIQKLKGPVAICADKKEKEILCPEWVSNSKTPVLYVSNIELLRQLLQNEFSEDNQQDKKGKKFLMQFVTHGYGRFRQGRMALRPLTHTEMNMFLDMDIYLNRVSTFVDWPNKSISSLQLAKAGFIYEGEGEKVRCFSCGLTISDFPAEFVPLNSHHAESNNCNFLKSLESNNASEINNKLLRDAVSEGQRDGKTQPHIQNTFPQSDQDQSNDNVLDSILATDKTQTRHNGLDSSTNLQPTRTHTDIDERSVKDRSGNNSLTNWTVDNNSNLSDNILGSAKHPQFIGIHNRLKSFIGWSHRHIKEPRYFVEAGFYFTGKEDIVRCFFCDIGLAEWISEDDPWVEHARHSPSCLFVIEKRGRDFVENIQQKWRQIYCPKHTEFEELDARIRSFSNWPSNIIQQPKQLASAGFYYTGKNDEVRCHYCTGGLKGWEEGDEPWTEHARWFPSCKFLIKSKGSAYVEEIARKYNSNHVTAGSRRTCGQDDQSRTDQSKNTQSLDNGINSEAAKRVQPKVDGAINELIKEMANFTEELSKIDIESASIESLQLAMTKLRAEILVCKSCQNAERCIIFVPCGHRLVCEPCSKKLKQCLHCKKRIKKCIKTYLA